VITFVVALIALFFGALLGWVLGFAKGFNSAIEVQDWWKEKERPRH
jgi:hypothetical protein